MKEDEEKVLNIEDDEEIDQETLRKIVIGLFNETCSIEEAIKEKQEEYEILKESYKVTKKSCNNVSFYRRFTTIRLEFMKFQTNIIRLYSCVINDGNSELLAELVEKIDETKKDFVVQKDLLKCIKKAIIVLRKYRAVACYLEISNLLSNIYAREEVLLDELSEHIKACNLATSGIHYISPSKNQETLAELSNSINKSILSLGLYKTSSDKK